MALWLITSEGRRYRLLDRSFAPSFYVAGRERQLSRLSPLLEARAPVACSFTEKRNLWEDQPLRVLEVCVPHPLQFFGLARLVRRLDSTLQLFNSDLMLAPLYCWQKKVFPLARVEVEVEAGEEARSAGRETLGVKALHCRDDEWVLDFELPPLTMLSLRLEGLSRVDPQHGRRGALEVEVSRWEGERFSASRTLLLDDSEEPVVCGFERLLRRHDPDIILTEWGDSTLFPALMGQAEKRGVRLSLNRDPLPIQRSRARSYMSYGRILFKESATTLFGRLHVDTQNSFITHQCELDGLWELARLTKLPVQYACRTTTGTGISHLQMELAYHDGVLIPEQKAEPESPKHPDELLSADRGGLVFPPRLGFFENVCELDFVSEYPSIMARFNVSPETVNCACCPEAPRIPELGYRICTRRRGITSRVVERLIAKRQRYKQAARENAARAPSYLLRRSALKWLLVCCFGYTGYKNARFGKIEAHEAINAVAREKLLVAKEAAEERGYRVLHALVDSLYVQKEGATSEDYERLAVEIESITNLPLAVEAVYRYVVFLPSKQYAEIPVPNRFFCVVDEDHVKIRGLECRRHDTPRVVARMQNEVLHILAEARDFESYCVKLEQAREVLNRYLDGVTKGDMNPEELLITRRLTRQPEAYTKNNHTAIVARQLDRAGVQLRAGENIQYLLCRTDSALPDDRVRAWTLWEAWRGYDIGEYQQALLEAFQPFTHYVDRLYEMPG